MSTAPRRLLAIVALVVCGACTSNTQTSDDPGASQGATGSVAQNPAPTFVSSSPPSESSELSQSSENESAEVVDPVVRLQSYSPNDEALIWNATQEAIYNCMRASGFNYTAIPGEDIEGNRKLALKVDRLDLDLAEAAGYHADRLPLNPEATLALEAYNVAGAANARESELNPSFLLALEGADGGEGCVRQAYDLLYGERPSLLDLFGEFVLPAVQDLYVRADLSADVINANDAWSECMAALGLSFETPRDARIRFSEALTLTSEEQTVAVADSGCRRQTQLYERSLAALSAEVDMYLEANPGLSERLSEARAADVASAKKVLGVP
jgi:hypothetical protein